ncbi:hypothetical protein C0991_010542 [Blastosporella zonata]|nr:hypothetical protein C0991_010542 [Blastosporella zonata]
MRPAVAPAPVKPLPKVLAPPKVPVEPPVEPPFNEPPKQPTKPITTAKPASTVKPTSTTKATAKPTAHCTKKRATNPVDEAVHSRTTRLGFGQTSEVYQTMFEGKEAVVKVVDTSRPGGSAESVTKEVANLKTVNQLLGWGEKKNDARDHHFFYIIMPNMGVSAKDTKLSEEQLGDIVKTAKANYLAKYHMENKDQNPNNYVYRQVDGKWQAEIIDWARATYYGKTPQPAAGTPEEVTDPSACATM